jgi:diaminopimelate decarboxylase
MLKGAVKQLIGRGLLHRHRRAWRAESRLERERLAPAYWDAEIGPDGHLAVQGVDLARVADEFGTPLHVVDVARLRANYYGFLDAFSGIHAPVHLGTSYKTNPAPFVLSSLHAWGSRAEVISHFELWLALKLGVPADRIIFNGPGKPREALEAAVAGGIGLVNVDSLEELEALEAVCAAQGRPQRIGIRVTGDVGWEQQFGLPIGGGVALEAFRRAHRSPHLRPVGVHLHLGTGIGEPDTYARGISQVLDLARSLRRDPGLTLEVLDFGGGFGVPTTRTLTEWDHRLQYLRLPVRPAIPERAPRPTDYAARIEPLLSGYLAEGAAGGVEVVFEPGRAITGSAQMLLLRVLRVKQAGRATRDVILDGGRNLCLPLAWEFHEIHPVSRMREGPLLPQSLYGPLCHPGDIVAQHKLLPPLVEGDVVAVMDAGAYFLPNETCFSQPRPGMVAITEGHARTVSRAETFSDLVARAAFH